MITTVVHISAKASYSFLLKSNLIEDYYNTGYCDYEQDFSVYLENNEKSKHIH